MISEVAEMKSLGATVRVLDVIAPSLRTFFKMYNGNPAKTYGKVTVRTGKSSLNSHVLMCLNPNISPTVISVA